MSTRLAPTGQFFKLTKRAFKGGQKLMTDEDDGLGAVLVNQRARLRGVIPSARIPYSANPANGNVFQIGAATFQFVTALGAVTTYTQIKVLGTAALSLAAALNAINGVADANVVQGTTWTATNFANPVVADAPTATVLRLRAAATQGGTPVSVVSASVALTVTITAGAAAWSVANLNASGKALGDQDLTVVALTITAAMLTAAAVDIELDFTPTVVLPQTLVAGVITVRTDAITIVGNAVHVALPGGGAPHFVAGDVLVLVICA